MKALWHCQYWLRAALICLLISQTSSSLNRTAYYSLPHEEFSTPTRPQKVTRRALLIGIANYEHRPDYHPLTCDDSSPLRQVPTKVTRSKVAFPNLAGPINDVCKIHELLIAGFGFEERNVHVLIDGEATRAGVLAAFKRYLIDEADPGDVCLFYYSGHGSQLKNSLGGEADQLDETIVPYDWKRNIRTHADVKDIRDKEIFKLFKDASRKVTLTALFDSCYSGGVTRDTLSDEQERSGPAELQFDLREAPPESGQMKLTDEEYLESSGVLMISAAREFERAREHSYEGKTLGNFTYALLQVLQSPNARNLSSARLFNRLIIEMKRQRVSHEPVIVGSTTRRRQTLTGELASQSKVPDVNVLSVESDGTIYLQGGRAQGLQKGCEFIKKTESGQSVRIRIRENPDLVKSLAEVVENDSGEKTRIAATIKPNDVFTLDRWTVSGGPDLTVWAPPAKLSLPQLKLAASEIEKLGSYGPRVQLILDPIAILPTHFLFYNGVSWMLKVVDGQTLDIGPILRADSVLSKLNRTNDQVKIFASLPPAVEMENQLKLGADTRNNAVEWTKNPQAADYWLVGRYDFNKGDANLEYAWLASTAFSWSGTNDRGVERSTMSINPMPQITGWRAKASDIQDLALRLSKIRGWTRLESPDNDRFAYRLVLKNAEGQSLLSGKAVVFEGDLLDVLLVADPDLIKPPVVRRHVYVLTLDQSGKSDLIYPMIDSDEIDKPVPFVPESGEVKPEILLGRIKICGSACTTPGILGTETYIMITTAEKLPDPTVLISDGVRTAEDLARERQARGVHEDTLLENLLRSIGSTSRAPQRIVPLDWSVEYLFLRSAAKKP